MTDQESDRQDIDRVDGWQEFIQWWDGPFHYLEDSEVRTLILMRRQCTMQLCAFKYTSEVRNDGYFVTDKHCMITVIMDDVKTFHLEGFSTQNALLGLRITHERDLFRLELTPAYGIGGWIEARRCSMTFIPLLP